MSTLLDDFPTETIADTVTQVLTAIVTATTTVTLSASLGAYPGNDTSTNSPVFDAGSGLGDADLPGEGNAFVNFILGLLIVLASSILNAFGLNLTKLDHTRNTSLPKAQRKPDWMRPLWLVGMLSYISSQLFGSTLSLRYLRSDWVAPLGSSSLVFNFLFAKWLVGTPVTDEDVRGTALIVVGVILILIFSSINHGLDQTITVARLSLMWRRGGWLAWFFFIAAVTLVMYTSTHLISLLGKSRASLSPTLPAYDSSLPPSADRGQRGKKAVHGFMGYVHLIERKRKASQDFLVGMLDRRVFERTDDVRLKWLEGVGWAVVGGSLAGGCLVFTKAVVKLLSLPDRPFAHFSAVVTLLMVAITAVMQIICLNRALKCADSTLVVPLFFAGYTVLGFVNSLIFLGEWGQYETWVLVATFLSICVLVGGVVLLSLKKPESTGDGKITSVADPSMRLNPVTNNSTATRPAFNRFRSGSTRSRRSQRNDNDSASLNAMGIAERSAWEVGSVSDEESEKDTGRGVGGRRSLEGERGGLLFDKDDELEDDRPAVEGAGTSKSSYVGLSGRADDTLSDDKEDPFGDFEKVPSATDKAEP